MSIIKKPVHWEVFNVPPIQPVQYYSILKQQREFSQLIKNYDAEVFQYGYLHYCGIIPKFLNSSNSTECEIFIVFLNETQSTSFIGFRIMVNKETFIYESKYLLLFLKNSKAIFYSINNNCIHVYCKRNSWELFYLLYDDYLKRNVFSIIGTRFFYYSVYFSCIEKEKLFIKWISKESKVIKVSKSSIYYKIHRKRKVSVTDLIHMSLNMPKRKKYTISSFDFKEPLLQSNLENDVFYTVAGNKINISKLVPKKYKQVFVNETCSHELIQTSITQKRKFDEVNSDQNLELVTSSKYSKSSELCSVSQWKQFQKLNLSSVQNYSSISFISSLVSCNTNFDSTKIHSSAKWLFSLSSDRKNDAIKNSTIIPEASVLKGHTEKDVQEKVLCEGTLMNYSGSIVSKDFSSHHSSFPNNYKESLLSAYNSDFTMNCDINTVNFSTRNENIGFKSEDVDFTTAAGKVINISSSAMLKAYKLCEKEQILPEKTTCDTEQKVPAKNTIDNIYGVKERNICVDSKRTCLTKDISLHNFSKNNTENQKPDSFDVMEDVAFFSAAGKTINISNIALETAQKLICSVNVEDVDNGCTSKADDVDMDNTLVEKFFEDVHFEEKELELNKNDIEKDNLKTIFKSKNDKNIPTHKPRKSLGGRRRV